MEEEEYTVTLLVCGKTQIGKSHLLKRYFGMKTKVGNGLFTETQKCVRYSWNRAYLKTYYNVFDYVTKLNEKKILLRFVDTPGFSQIHRDSTTVSDIHVCDDIFQEIKGELVLLWVVKFGTPPCENDIKGLRILRSKFRDDKRWTIGIVFTYCMDGIPHSSFTSKYFKLLQSLNELKLNQKSNPDFIFLEDSIKTEIEIDNEYGNIWKTFTLEVERVWRELIPDMNIEFSYYDVDERLPLLDEDNNVLLPDGTPRNQLFLKNIKTISGDTFIFCNSQ